MPFFMKSHFPVKWIVSLDAISNEIAFSCEEVYLFSIKWPITGDRPCLLRFKPTIMHKTVYLEKLKTCVYDSFDRSCTSNLFFYKIIKPTKTVAHHRHYQRSMDLPFVFQINILFTTEYYEYSQLADWEIRNYITFYGIDIFGL